MARYTQLQEDDVQRIASSYGLTVVDFEPIAGGATNSNYLLRARQGRYVLTIFEVALPRVIRLGRLLLLLAEHEFPTSRLLAPIKGGVATVYMNKPVMLKAYIAGQVCQDLDDAMLRQVGAAMARLHQVPAPDFLPDEHSYSQQTIPDVIGRNVNPEYESWLAHRLAYLEGLIPPGLPRGLIHGDLFWDNVLFEDQELKAIIDLEEACCYYKAFDLGMGIVGTCAVDTTMSLEKARALVTGYQEVRALEKGERQVLQPFVEYAAASTSAWRFWKYHIDAPSEEKADKPWQMVRIAKEASAIPKERFLAVIFN